MPRVGRRFAARLSYSLKTRTSTVMNLPLLSPGYPADMPEFARGPAEAGARVWGVGDTPPGDLPPLVRRSLTDYIAVH